MRMLTRSRRGHLLLTAVLGASVVITGTSTLTAGATAGHRAPFIREVEPWVPGSPPSTPPAVDLTAACVRLVGGGELEAVFGYNNPGQLSVYSGLNPVSDIPGANVIVRETRRLRPPRVSTEIEATGPQATLFLPGNHPHVFAVRFKLNETVAWRVRIPSSDDPVIDPGWKVTVKPRLLAPCGWRVPAHFAVVQAADMSSGPTNVRRDVNGGITAYDVEFSAQNVIVVCSAGGSVLPFEQVVGWTMEPNLVPLVDVVEVVVSSNGAVFEMSPTRERAVVDEFVPVEWFGPIADVTGRCDFGGKVVESDVFWAGQPSSGLITPIVVDGRVVQLDASAVLPGGSRLR